MTLFFDLYGVDKVPPIESTYDYIKAKTKMPLKDEALKPKLSDQKHKITFGELAPQKRDSVFRYVQNDK
jgi:hypothetical protein